VAPTLDRRLLVSRANGTQPNIFSADETADVGIDNQTPVAEGIGIGVDTRFTGKIDNVTPEPGQRSVPRPRAARAGARTLPPRNKNSRPLRNHSKRARRVSECAGCMPRRMGLQRQVSGPFGARYRAFVRAISKAVVQQ
jgi:hypothetical protein